MMNSTVANPGWYWGLAIALGTLFGAIIGHLARGRSHGGPARPGWRRGAWIGALAGAFFGTARPGADQCRLPMCRPVPLMPAWAVAGESAGSETTAGPNRQEPDPVLEQNKSKRIERPTTMHEQMTVTSEGLQVVCPKCGQANRVRFADAHREARCGKCQTELPHRTQPLVISGEEAFDALVQSAAVPVLVDFWAPWCGPCRYLAPELERLAQQAAGEVMVAKVNVDENPTLAERFAISAIPTLILFRDGQVSARTMGMQTAEALHEFALASARR